MEVYDEQIPAFIYSHHSILPSWKCHWTSRSLPKLPGHPHSSVPEAAEIQTGKAPIDPNIYVTLERQGTARVLVILQQQADLSGASRLQTKAEKGAFVYHQLTTIAERTQGPLRALPGFQGG